MSLCGAAAVQVYVKRHLQTGLPAATFASMLMTFSAQTSANMTQVTCSL
jgi:hypothetical protein